MKMCYRCQIKKDLSAFGKSKFKKDGLQSNCRDCISTEQRTNRKEGTTTEPVKGSYLWHLKQSNMYDYYKRYTTNS